ncbi:major facilitator superfamily domain-containing protein [Dactylonectria macrodidyma]|uniref:Major facilitator superfamily domain-containing protein n=1 Tax=Dactylonectria macrodidyma TaxID=307937 RepID=A0A9P9D3K6_9HYPO|nr:major facilitator superfamily domain-containing protein [Dactylonectria macrodidyma]
MSSEKPNIPRWRRLLGAPGTSRPSDEAWGPSRWSMGVLNDKKTIEVPGSVLLLASHRNEALGQRNVQARTSHSSIPAGFPVSSRRNSTSSAPGARAAPRDEATDKKKTSDGAIILEPQPEESANDPLNWPAWRRDLALLSLGFYCMLGGGTTPIIAAGFTDVARTYKIEVETVSLTTGLYMMGMGLGSVIFSPTAILWGKRPVYLGSAILFIGTSLWAAWSPSFNSLLAARVFQGVAVSPVECLPSATIAEIFFLHERAYRIGIYTLLLLGGKNLVPLVSAAIIGSFGWRWAFWIMAMIIGLGVVLLFLFVPETFWDRTPHARPRHPSKRPGFLRRLSSRHRAPETSSHLPPADDVPNTPSSPDAVLEKHSASHVGFAPEAHADGQQTPASETVHRQRDVHVGFAQSSGFGRTHESESVHPDNSHRLSPVSPKAALPASDEMAAANSPYFTSTTGSESNVNSFKSGPKLESEGTASSQLRGQLKVQAYTHNLRQQPTKSFTQQLRPWHGRLNNDNWFKVMVRPFILFAYPAVLWSSAVYACSVGWLIVISESMAMIYRDPHLYNFDALQTGLVYISPFVGGILGTGVAGKVSDIIVRAMARRNGGLYEPEFRLVMAAPILVTTCVGLMGFGWSAEEKYHWMVPTIFFGVISFGCSLGSTTAITFCVDSYRQYAGEALVTLNFSKNVLHGLIFSLFVTHWLRADGAKMVYIWIGIIQLLLMLCTIPMYIYGKRARMWTVRVNLMEKF